MYDKDHTGRYDVLHDDKSTYRLAIVHESEYKAERAIKELGLDGAFPISAGQALSGRKYQKIVILCDLSKMHQGPQFMSYLVSKMPISGRIIDLS